MSLQFNYKELTANYIVEKEDDLMRITVNGIRVDLPAYDNIDIKDIKSFYFIADESFQLRILDSTLFSINGLASYTVPIGKTIQATLMSGDPTLAVGQWSLIEYDVTSAGGGGGITSLTGDVTGTGPGATATTIANDAITFAKMQNIATDSLIGRDTAGTGDPENITLNATLSMNAGTLQREALTGDVTATAGSNATTIANNVVTPAKQAQVAAYKFLANNTNAVANLAANDFQANAEATYTGTITWTAGAAPSGASNLLQFFTRIGNLVTWKIMFTYAVTGTTVTNVSLTFPTQFPTPHIPTGFTGASVRVWNCDFTRLFTTPSGTVTNAGTFFIIRNAGDTAFNIESTGSFGSGSYRTFHFGGSYFTS